MKIEFTHLKETFNHLDLSGIFHEGSNKNWVLQRICYVPMIKLLKFKEEMNAFTTFSEVNYNLTCLCTGNIPV
jgi:hypothetical protein